MPKLEPRKPEDVQPESRSLPSAARVAFWLGYGVVVAAAQALDLQAVALTLVIAAGLICSFVGAVQVGNTLFRIWHGDFKVKAARPFLFAEALYGFSMLVLGLIAMSGSTRWLILPVVVLLAATVGYAILEGLIVVALGDQKTGTHWVKNVPLLGVKKTLGQVEEDNANNILGKSLGWFFKDKPRKKKTRISQTRVRIALVAVFALGTMVTSIVGAFVGHVVAVKTKAHTDRGQGQAAGKGKGKADENQQQSTDQPAADSRGADQSPDNSSAGSAAGTGATVQETTTEGTWPDYCDGYPGADGPRWARRALYDVYLGDGAPAYPATGCTMDTHTLGSNFAYVQGVDPSDGALRSVGVAVLGGGATLFLAPAAAPVLELIHGTGPLSGSSRCTIGSGDFYLVYTSHGTVALIRATKWAEGKNRVVQLYLQLPSVVVRAWGIALAGAGGWLWPKVTGSADGLQTISFITPTGSIAQTLVYDHATHSATRTWPAPQVVFTKPTDVDQQTLLDSAEVGCAPTN